MRDIKNTISVFDKFMLASLSLLFLSCALLAFQIYQRPQFGEVSKLIAVEAPITAAEKQDILLILEHVLAEIEEADQVRAEILREITEAGKVRAQQLEILRQLSGKATLETNGPE